MVIKTRVDPVKCLCGGDAQHIVARNKIKKFTNVGNIMLDNVRKILVKDNK